MANFPHELVFDVLSRLPVKSVLRLRCVCKSWCSLISDHQFVKTHLNQAITDITVGCQRLLMPHNNYKAIKSIDYEALQLLSEKELEEAMWNNGGNACTVLDFPWSGQDHRVRFVGSCHGMVALLVGRDKIVLCNPCTREFRELPKPTNISINFEDAISGGLCYDSYVDDYKFVIAVDEVGDSQFKAEVFSLRSNSWRIIQDIPPDISYIFGFGIGVYLNGALHWIAILKPWSQQIISFDLATEKFQKLLPLPPDQGNNEIRSYDYSNIILLGGCLSVSDNSSSKINVWVMKEYSVEASWTKLFTLSIRFEHGHHYLRAVCILMNGQLIVDMDDEIIIYNPKYKNYRKLYHGSWWFNNHVVQYIESLVSPNAIVENN